MYIVQPNKKHSQRFYFTKYDILFYQIRWRKTKTNRVNDRIL